MASTSAEAAHLHLADFFLTVSARSELVASLRRAPPLAAPLLLAGPPRSGKTSLLFQLARSLAERGGAPVVVLGARRTLEAAPPLLAAGGAAGDAAWARVGVRFVDDGAALLRYAALLHLAEEPPGALLVDDLSGLLAAGAGAGASAAGDGGPGGARARDAALCRALAALRDAAEHAGARAGRPVALVVAEASAGPGDPPRTPWLLRRWLPVALAAAPAPGAPGRFRLGALGGGGGMTGWAAEYSLGAGGLTLEGVVAAG
jgi:hypothetical protein